MERPTMSFRMSLTTSFSMSFSMSTARGPRTVVAASAALLLGLALTTAALADGRYGYYRIVEGSANVVQDSTSDPGPGISEFGRTDLGPSNVVQENQPLLSGDRLLT